MHPLHISIHLSFPPRHKMIPPPHLGVKLLSKARLYNYHKFHTNKFMLTKFWAETNLWEFGIILKLLEYLSESTCNVCSVVICWVEVLMSTRSRQNNGVHKEVWIRNRLTEGINLWLLSDVISDSFLVSFWLVWVLPYWFSFLRVKLPECWQTSELLSCPTKTFCQVRRNYSFFLF